MSASAAETTDTPEIPGSDDILDLLVIGAGPTGISIGAEAREKGLSVLLVDRGALTAAIQGYPTFMEFFTTRDRLEIANIPFAIPEDKPTRRQALAYYRFVVERYKIPLALHEQVVEVTPESGDGIGFRVVTEATSPRIGASRTRRARAVAFATGYFGNPVRLGVPGEDLPHVHNRYLEAYPHYGEDVVIVGGGNTAVEAALDLWRNGARVSIVHRRAATKPGVKYWLKPDIENRIAEGSITAHFESAVCAFRPGCVEISRVGDGPDGQREILLADAVYVLVGYRPEMDLLARSGIEIEPETLVPTFDPATCESNVPGLYVAGTIQAGRVTDRIFIENSRDHGGRIVAHLRRGGR
ncbi:MAG TPA: YpdA family putative bacillithiol disulfide reductase [Thermoanaerobaculia bacterium]|nr:YpdA family putative bacillithiol disulfide reductase [Thermoanaerobaculia bacterium]